MISETIVMGSAAVALLAYISWTMRGKSSRSSRLQNRGGRGITDEAAVAIEDVADDIMNLPHQKRDSHPVADRRADRQFVD